MKLLPFDLEKAKAGAKVVTRDGHPVSMIGTRRPQPGLARYVVYGLVNLPSHDLPCVWLEDGRYVSYGAENGHDLFLLPTIRKGWLNIFKVPPTVTPANSIASGGQVFATQEEALASINTNNKGYLTTVPIEWEEV